MTSISVDWLTVISLVEKNQADATDVAKLVVAAITIAAEIKSGKVTASNILPFLEKVAPDVIPILELIANVLFPGSGTLIEVVAILAQLLFFTATLTPTKKDVLNSTLLAHVSTI